MSKLSKLQPVLVEKTCDKCGDGLIKLKKECNDGTHLFRSTKYWYEYKCEKCGDIITSEIPLALKYIVFINPETKESYRLYL